MKIIFVNNSKVISGAEIHLMDLSLELAKLGAECVFLVRKGSPLGRDLDRHGFRTYPVFDENKLSIPMRIAKILFAEKADVVSVNREHNVLAVGLAAMIGFPFLRKKPKLVNVFHTPTGRWYPMLKAFDALIAVSEHTAQSFYKVNRGMEKKTTVIYHGIELPNVDLSAKSDKNRPRRFFKDKGFPIIGMVGELWKNQEELFDIAPYLIKHFPDITIAVVGGGHESTFSDLRGKIKDRGLENNFILTGRIDREFICDMFYDLDISVSTHRNEGFGIVHIESLSCCTPVVAYNSGGLVEILRNGGGILVDGQTEDFAMSVLQLLADDEKRTRLGMQGRELVSEKFLLEHMGKKHFDFYRNLLSDR